MKNNKANFKELPYNVKFATTNSNNEKDFITEVLIANLINNGISFNTFLEYADSIENKKIREESIENTTNIILDFISLNPEFAEILERNNKAHEFLNSLK
ncbi:hypothetical protein [Flavobacterium ovatum]|uniref:hypothetical protein n=1 Tax=Flavobacterium ovatum TaxID=1928857 RepID=UPI00345094B8